MKKILFLLIAISMTACAFPRSPGEANLLNGSRQYRPELFESGARGIAIVSMTDNLSSTGFFGREYEQVMSFKNLQNGEPFFFKTIGGDYDWAMLPIGEYEITNLYLQYSYTTCQQIGNSRQCTTHVETIENFEGNQKIRFTVKPGTASYIGNIELIQPDNQVSVDGKSDLSRTFKIEDRSAKIPVRQKNKWGRRFGKNYVVNLATVK